MGINKQIKVLWSVICYGNDEEMIPSFIRLKNLCDWYMGIKCHTCAVEVQTPTVCLRGLQSLNPGFGGNVRRCLVWHPLLQHSERYHSKPELYQKTNLLLFSRTSCTENLSLTYSLNPVFIHSFLPYFFFPSIDLRDIDRIITFFSPETEKLHLWVKVLKSRERRWFLQSWSQWQRTDLDFWHPAPWLQCTHSDTIPLFCLKWNFLWLLWEMIT